MREQGKKKGTVAPNGEEVERLRLLRGWGQERLEAESKVSRRTIQRIEAGEPALPETLRLLANALETSYENLLSRVDHNKLIVRRSDKEIVIKLNIEIHLAGSESVPPEVMRLLDLVKAILPDPQNCKILSITGASVLISLHPSRANAEMLRDKEAIAAFNSSSSFCNTVGFEQLFEHNENTTRSWFKRQLDVFRNQQGDRRPGDAKKEAMRKEFERRLELAEGKIAEQMKHIKGAAGRVHYYKSAQITATITIFYLLKFGKQARVLDMVNAINNAIERDPFFRRFLSENPGVSLRMDNEQIEYYRKEVTEAIDLYWNDNA